MPRFISNPPDTPKQAAARLRDLAAYQTKTLASFARAEPRLAGVTAVVVDGQVEYRTADGDPIEIEWAPTPYVKGGA